VPEQSVAVKEATECQGEESSDRPRAGEAKNAQECAEEAAPVTVSQKKLKDLLAIRSGTKTAQFVKNVPIAVYPLSAKSLVSMPSLILEGMGDLDKATYPNKDAYLQANFGGAMALQVAHGKLDAYPIPPDQYASNYKAVSLEEMQAKNLKNATALSEILGDLCSIPGACGALKTVPTEMVLASDLGFPVQDLLKIEAPWGGDQTKDAGKEAYLVVCDAPYLINLDESGLPVAYINAADAQKESQEEVPQFVAEAAAELAAMTMAADTSSERSSLSSDEDEEQVVRKPQIGFEQACSGHLRPPPPPVAHAGSEAPAVPEGQPPEMPMTEAIGTWSTEQSRGLGKGPEPPLHVLRTKCTVLSTAEEGPYFSVAEAVKALSDGSCSAPQGLCIVFSKSVEAYFLLWRSDMEEESWAVSAEIQARPVGVDQSSLPPGIFEEHQAEVCPVGIDQSSLPPAVTEEAEPRLAHSPAPKHADVIESKAPATSPCPVHSFNPAVSSPGPGGLLRTHEERVGLPKQPPPSPATPSAALSMAIAAAKKANASEEAAEFARIVGNSLVEQFAAEIVEVADTEKTSEAPPLPSTPGRTLPDATALPEALSPLSLDSSGQSPEKTVD
jgi:hypothetical protein